MEDQIHLGYKVKLQKINRSANYTYCITLPVVLVEMAGLKKGEEMEWTVEDKNTFVLTRRSPVPIKHRKPRAGPTTV